MFYMIVRGLGCSYCAKLIKCDMYRHMWLHISPGIKPVVAVSSVLVHSVEGHATGLHGSRPGGTYVPWDVKSASLKKFVPPWTVRRQVWTDSIEALSFGVYLRTC